MYKRQLPNILISSFSSGITVVCSFVLPGAIHMEIGIPLVSINNPISTSGLGLWSLEKPYWRSPVKTSPVTSSISVSYTHLDVYKRQYISKGVYYYP